MKPRAASARSGFTLIEVLLALALLAALLTAISQFVFSITEAWTKNRDEFVFVQHTRAVARHVDELLETAANSARASGTTAGAPAVAEMHLPDGGGTAGLLTFDLPVGDRLFIWPAQPLPEVRCALGWRKDEGLMLYWKSRLEKDFATADPRAALISPFVTALAYDYYDESTESWSTEKELQKNTDGQLRRPAPAPAPFLAQRPRVRGSHPAPGHDPRRAARLLNAT
ncbi:MAG: prepilin-type N-terminal cleavage/methylation domain-containing protein [Lacunisphaera sp.]